MENHRFCLKFKMRVSVDQALEQKDKIGKNEIFMDIPQKGGVASSHRLLTSIFLVVLLELSQSSEQLLAS